MGGGQLAQGRNKAKTGDIKPLSGLENYSSLAKIELESISINHQSPAGRAT